MHEKVCKLNTVFYIHDVWVCVAWRRTSLSSRTGATAACSCASSPSMCRGARRCASRRRTCPTSGSAWCTRSWAGSCCPLDVLVQIALRFWWWDNVNVYRLCLSLSALILFTPPPRRLSLLLPPSTSATLLWLTVLRPPAARPRGPSLMLIPGQLCSLVARCSWVSWMLWTRDARASHLRAPAMIWHCRFQVCIVTPCSFMGRARARVLSNLSD